MIGNVVVVVLLVVVICTARSICLSWALFSVYYYYYYYYYYWVLSSSGVMPCGLVSSALFSKRREPVTKQHCVTPQKTWILGSSTVRTWDITKLGAFITIVTVIDVSCVVLAVVTNAYRNQYKYCVWYNTHKIEGLMTWISKKIFTQTSFG